MKTSAVIDALGALAHEYRLAIYRLLVEQGPEGLAAGAIGERVGLVPSSLTFHLQALQRAGLFLPLPGRRFRQERADDHQRDGGNQSGNERIAPGFMHAVDGGQGIGVVHRKVVSPRDEQAPYGGESLGPAEDRFTLIAVREQFGEPGDGGDKFDTDADERRHAEEQQHLR